MDGESSLVNLYYPWEYYSHIHLAYLSKIVTKYNKTGPSLHRRYIQLLEKTDQGWINECCAQCLASREQF